MEFLGKPFSYWHKIQMIMDINLIETPEELEKLLQIDAVKLKKAGQAFLDALTKEK